jgi:hypothetical protein
MQNLWLSKEEVHVVVEVHNEILEGITKKVPIKTSLPKSFNHQMIIKNKKNQRKFKKKLILN